MNRRFTLLPLAVMLLCSTGPAGGDRIPSDSLGIVPAPRSVIAYSATYEFPKTVTIAARTPDERNVAQFAAEFLRGRGISATISPSGTTQLRLSLRPGIPPEGYTLRVEGSGIVIDASDGAGLFYGLQTLEQIFSSGAENLVHYVDITDEPAFAWRGIHLDVSRHFFGVPVVERYIDVAAHYKLNTFHWHLTDDQGWRIEIKRYPRLTQIGSCRAGTQIDKDPTSTDGKRYCGFYTQDQIREVVAYAKRRYVTIVPEIEMPGHSTAALAAYPQYACRPGPFAVSETWDVTSETYCPTDRTFAFLANVLSEVAALFPSRYIHVGGDEVPKGAWRGSAFVHELMQRENLQTYEQVQGYFERRVERELNELGRRMVGWDEILDGGVTRTATVMSWRGDAGGIKAAKRGNDVVMSPDGPLYFDAYQGDEHDEPEAIGNLSTPQMVYDYNPTPASLNDAQARHVLGVQGNLWTEYIANENYLFYMLMPRELALSEIAWTPRAQKNWDSFLIRSGKQYAWLDANHYNYRIPNPSFTISAPDLRIANVSPSVRTLAAQTRSNSIKVTISDPVPGASIRYTTGDAVATTSSPRYTWALRYEMRPGKVVHITAVAVLQNGRVSTPSELIVRR